MTLTCMIEKGVHLVLVQPAKAPLRRRGPLPVCRADGGLLPEIDIADSTDLSYRMEAAR